MTCSVTLPGRKLSFPADHYSHPDFRTEWWYYTGHLETETGKRYGYQVTFFRFGVRDRQQEMKDQPLFTDLYMAHFALSDIAAKKFIYRERINRGYGDRAGAETDRYRVWNEDWRVDGADNHHQIFVSDRGTTLKLSLRSLKPPTLHGDNGHSQKGEGEGRASYYYSLTRMQTDGALTIDGKTVSDAAGKTSWLYRPDFDAAGRYDLAVTVGDGKQPAQQRSWTVDVADVNRGIEMAQISPPTGQDVRKPIGESATFSVKATDKDGDRLRYAWTVDGKPAGSDEPALSVPVRGPGPLAVAVAITDGKLEKPETLKWRLNGFASEFKPAVSPSALTNLRFEKSQVFKLEPPAGQRILQRGGDIRVAQADGDAARAGCNLFF